MQEQTQAVAAGTLAQDQAYAIYLWPSDFLDAADAALENYEAEISALRDPSDEEIFAAVERVVLALNRVNDEHGRIETGEREAFCDYTDNVLTEAGIDVEQVTSRRGVGRHELTDKWRDW